MDPAGAFAISLTTFVMIGLAEIGDKSQIVCMTLASRHRHWPVLLGASSAFVLLNTLAVTFGAGVMAQIPDHLTAAVLCVLFGILGIHSLVSSTSADEPEVQEQPGRNLFFTTLSLIFLAEFGDKTQIAVAGLAGNMAPIPVWVGATAALVLVSAGGVWVGRALLQRMPTHWLHRIAGIIFLMFAMLAGWQALTLSL